MADPYERSCEILKMADDTQRIYRASQDAELMREALEALKPLTEWANDVMVGFKRRQAPFYGDSDRQLLIIPARAAIAKLEQRLLRE